MCVQLAYPQLCPCEEKYNSVYKCPPYVPTTCMHAKKLTNNASDSGYTKQELSCRSREMPPRVSHLLPTTNCCPPPPPIKCCQFLLPRDNLSTNANLNHKWCISTSSDFSGLLQILFLNVTTRFLPQPFQSHSSNCSHAVVDPSCRS